MTTARHTSVYVVIPSPSEQFVHPAVELNLNRIAIGDGWRPPLPVSSLGHSPRCSCFALSDLFPPRKRASVLPLLFCNHSQWLNAQCLSSSKVLFFPATHQFAQLVPYILLLSITLSFNQKRLFCRYSCSVRESIDLELLNLVGDEVHDSQERVLLGDLLRSLALAIAQVRVRVESEQKCHDFLSISGCSEMKGLHLPSKSCQTICSDR